MINEIEIVSHSGWGSVVMSRGNYRSYYLDDVDWGQVEASHNTYSYYNQVGADIVSSSIGTRDISISGFVVESQGTMLDRCKFLNTFISPSEDYDLIYEDKKITFRPDLSIVWSREYKYNNIKGRKFLIQGTCGFPLFSGVDNIEKPFDATTSLFKFPHDFGSGTPFAYSSNSETFTVKINNEGGFDTGLIIVIRFADSVTNPKLINETTGKFIGVDYTFLRGDVLRINTTSGQKSITRTDELGETTNMIRYRNVDTSWIQLVPGVNQLSLNCDNASEIGGMTTTVYYTPLYQEVE